MRIAQISPLAEAVPPRLYGGTERVVGWLTEALVELGHDVTLFASGDSITSADLVSCAPTGLRLAGINDHNAYHLVMLDRVRRMKNQFDILHFHVDLLPLALFQDEAGKCLTTLHGRQDLPDSWPAYTTFTNMSLVSISDNQRTPMPPANFIGTVYHGLPETLIPYSAGPGDYLAFLGRMSPEKRPDRAIAIATAAGVKLKIAAKVDKVDQVYFHQEIEPLLHNPLIEFIGEIGDAEKADFLGNARALLFTIDWPEPFGLVMIEAMAAGTPVIAWDSGSVPEVIDDGLSGLIVHDLEEAVAAVGKAAALPRRMVRDRFEARFTARRMATDYVRLYEARAGAPMRAGERRPFSHSLPDVELLSYG
ncbi:glycosyltransferase family 4 protein [Allosphingosinicella flava]|uniref:Glycosyltransferase family 4 protein n=1 Tax=Allosphingosinicella flava TaxID=2771430 RepID=A0A7T2LLC3_9SPHN|nr:glycosyltransferase family 4 protein [Sphingosinicella flava]QPQ54370.1 glycosyltransferase family 4 protein [Sphingosinicella flava]